MHPTISTTNVWSGFCFSCRNVDDVHNLMDEVAEQQEIANEISDAISNPTGFGQDVDEVRLPILSKNCLAVESCDCVTWRFCIVVEPSVFAASRFPFPRQRQKCCSFLPLRLSHLV